MKRFPWHRVDPALPPKEYDEAIMAKLHSRCRRLPNGCLEYLGTKTGNGYGSIQYHSKATPVHVLTYRIRKGPIPKGFDVAHSCDHPPCCEETHLSLKTRRENLLESVARNRHALARKTHCKRGHKLSGANMYMYRNSRHCRACNTARHRINAGWPEALAWSAPKVKLGYVPPELVRVKPPKRRPHGSSHCPHGHEIAGRNVYTSPDGYRKCRRCRTDASLRWRPKPIGYGLNTGAEHG